MIACVKTPAWWSLINGEGAARPGKNVVSRLDRSALNNDTKRKIGKNVWYGGQLMQTSWLLQVDTMRPTWRIVCFLFALSVFAATATANDFFIPAKVVDPSGK
jgi:hypothetical protein